MKNCGLIWGYVEGLSDVLWHITKNDGLWAATEPKP